MTTPVDYYQPGRLNPALVSKHFIWDQSHRCGAHTWLTLANQSPASILSKVKLIQCDPEPKANKNKHLKKENNNKANKNKPSHTVNYIASINYWVWPKAPPGVQKHSFSQDIGKD